MHEKTKQYSGKVPHCAITNVLIIITIFNYVDYYIIIISYIFISFYPNYKTTTPKLIQGDLYANKIESKEFLNALGLPPHS